ncbi:hypothetical protein GCM10007100_36110 [Roseibacillus persicicus]|uniref:Glycosyl transferase family 1 domain-containing protein n=2 Tax=Roseibacillus persicicus TaxID=454148 RepID=A0A918TVB2_9BACT|nr:hypothetical protein GCM10007100_36110 [Roseibacillus persicicus]
MKERFIEAGLPSEKVVSLRHSWDAKAFSEERADEGYYLFLSRLVSEKGVKTLLEAWKLLSQRLGDRTPQLKIGGTGILEDEVREFAKKNSFVEFLGFVDGEKKSRLIANCRAMLAPSIWWEPLGLVTYEAYESSKPMIAASSGGLTETVTEGVTGFLHEAGDANSLLECVLKLEELAPGERQKLGDRGRAWLLSEASPESWKKSFQDVISEV